ncbi:hypothetical protein [Actinomadura nitritigenes]|uniref:hypothetical protein n=1 Tax=Actinomadura nitritigenes TaxID=134602 RepID=UPI003D8EEA19
MPDLDGSRPLLALALTGGQAQAVPDEDALASLLDRAPLAFTVAGAERVAPAEAGGDRTVDPSMLATVLAARTATAAFLVASSPMRDHPYNLARRVASLGHLSRGRTGLVLGVADPLAVAGRARGEGPELTRRAGVAEAHDLAWATRELEQTWPYDAIVADREQRIFARGDRIRRADHQGVYSVAGPLTLPAPRDGASVLAWWANGADELAAAADVADVVIVPRGLASGARSALDAASGRHFADPGRRPLLFTVVDVPPGTTAADARASVAAASEADGIVLRPTGSDPREAVELAGRLHTGEHLPAGPLRARLGLPEAADLLPDGPGVFPAPVPQR